MLKKNNNKEKVSILTSSSLHNDAVEIASKVGGIDSVNGEKIKVAYVTPSMQKNEKSFEAIIGDNLKVKVDTKSQAQFVSFPFTFEDGVDGVITLIKVTPIDWKPVKDISRVIIYFK